MEQENVLARWRGKATAKIKGSTAQQVWPLWADFCGLVKLFPHLDACYQVDGKPGEPGLVRHVAGKIKPPSLGGIEEAGMPFWAIEKLLSIDPELKTLSYNMSDGSLGFSSYVATVKILAIDDRAAVVDDRPGPGCKVEWSFVVVPIEGWRLGDLVSYFQHCLEFMTQKMEKALQ